MPLQLFPIQFPTTPIGHSRIPLLLLFDGSGLAFSYTSLLPLDRLVYGVSVVVPTKRDQYQEYLDREYGCVDDYVDQLVRVVDEVLGGDNDDDDESDSEEGSALVPRPSALHIGGFSLGGFLAIELTRRLLSRADPIKILSLILFDSFNPSAPEVRTTYQEAIHSRSPVLPYPPEHPLAGFIAAHLMHLMKLTLMYDVQPLAPGPPVYYLRAVEDANTGELDECKGSGYWTRVVLPTLEMDRAGVLRACEHLGMWNPERVGEVTEWLRGVLGSA